MKKFLNKISFFLGFVVVLYAICSIIFLGKNDAKNNFMAAIEDKHNVLDSINKPTLIFAGGSNLTFGLNSPTLEKELKMPVVNLSLHAGLGLNFMVEELKQVAKTGDVIVLSIEYFLSLQGDYNLKKYTSSFYPIASTYFKNDVKKNIINHFDNTRTNVKSACENLFRAISPVPNDDVYSRKGFNENGDLISHLSKQNLKVINGKAKINYTYWDGIDALNKLQLFLQQKNIKVYFVFPCFPKNEFEQNKEAINKLANDLKLNLKIPILSTPEAFVFNDDLFFDSVYHLNKEGRDKRTDILLNILKILNAQSPFFE